MSETMAELMQTIRSRRNEPSQRSYTSQLLTGGVSTISNKIIEEAAEVVDAACHGHGHQDHQVVIHEVADLVYHLCVLLGSLDLDWVAVESELRRRFGTSGLDEKASRTPQP